MSSSSSSPSADDPDIEIIKARKLREMKEKAATRERIKEIEKTREKQREKTPQGQDQGRELFLKYLYDRGDEVLAMAESQYPVQTRAIISQIADLIKSGEVRQRISGGELLALFRSVGLNIRMNTTIKIEDHGKMVSISDKLRQESEDDKSDNNEAAPPS